jgi:glycosyltransferase involved in cell wall biosynthesis
MKVAFLPHIPHYTSSLSESLMRLGVDVEVIKSKGGNPSGGNSIELLRRVHLIPSRSVEALRQARFLARFDLIHAQGGLNSIPAVLANRMYGTRFIVTAHGIPSPDIEPIGMNLLFEVAEYRSLKPVSRYASAVVTISEFAKRELQRRNRVSAEVIYHGVDSATFNSALDGSLVRRNLGIRPDERLVLWASRMTPLKDPLIFAKAAISISRRISAVRFLMVGNGPLRAAAEREARELVSDGKMTIVDAVPFGEISGYYAASDVFVYTSTREGFGLAVAEAMACGTPIVACNAGSLPEVVGGCGRYFSPHDDKDIADSLERSLIDKEETREMAVRGVERIRKTFTWGRAAEAYLSVYRTALSRS